MTFAGSQATIWVTGAEGRMGQAIVRHLDSRKYTVFSTGHEIDVTDLKAVTDYVHNIRPDWVINCAGLVGIQKAEENRVEAYRVNALGARNVAIASESAGASIIHLSTDDIYPQPLKSSVNEFDIPYPYTVYGKSKLAGERFVTELNPRHIIVRSSWVYTALPQDIVMRAITAIKAGETFEVPVNQYAAPTSVTTYAKFIIAVMESGEYGTFHATTKGLTSRYEFVEEIVRNAGLSAAGVVGTSDPDAAYRIELENLMIQLTDIYEMPTWQDDLRAYMTKHGLMAK